jgi:protein-L-isoaspartate O-methyltransferase
VAIAERLLWAVSALDVQPADRILEIGCGQGIAVSLVCDRLNAGRIVALDRSAVMADAAARRNAANIAMGKAVVASGDFASACPQGTFDKIFSVNVSAFWKLPGDGVGVLAQRLAPGGRLYVFHQPPKAVRNREVIEKAAEVLALQGFLLEDVLCEDMEPAPAICLTAGVATGLSLVNTEVRHHAGDDR